MTTAAPVVPTGLVAVPGNGMVTLAWHQVTGALTYSVYRSTSAGSDGAGIATGILVHVDNTLFPPEPENFLCDFADSTVTNVTAYYYKVTAVNTTGESPKSSQVTATPIGASTTITKSRFLKIMPMGNSITSG